MGKCTERPHRKFIHVRLPHDPRTVLEQLGYDMSIVWRLETMKGETGTTRDRFAHAKNVFDGEPQVGKLLCMLIDL